MADMMPTPTKTMLAQASGTPMLLGFHAYGHVADYPLHGRQMLGRASMGADDAGSAVDVKVPSAYVSSRHGELGVLQGRVFYRDLGSRNGTLVNGALYDATVGLREGDSLSFAPRQAPDEVGFKLVLAYVEGGALAWQRVPFGSDVQEVVVGRSSGSVLVSDPTLSQRHASFFQSSQGPMVLDLGSKNGVFVNGKQVEGACPLRALDVVRIGDVWVSVHEGCLFVGAPEAYLVTGGGSHVDDTAIDDAGAATTDAAIGGAEATGGDAAIGGAEATGEKQAAMPAPDSLASHVQAGGGGGAERLVIDIVERNVWSRLSKKTLLKDISLSVDPGDMVLILGGSGAGKSTFVKAVMGYDKAEGTIRYGDLDVYEEYDRLRYQIGYVPQQDLLRMNDSVEMTLLAAAQMRMPGRPTTEQCQDRADWASEVLGLGREQQTLVGSLSGGQRKRLSIAVELVGDPDLFFLDEPDSGLDGVMARALMENLRDIADMGKMVLVITHGPDRASDLFTKVLVLAKSERDGAGHLAFYGSVQGAREFFGVDTLEGVVRRINRTDEGGEGLADYYLDKASDAFGYARVMGAE